MTAASTVPPREPDGLLGENMPSRSVYLVPTDFSKSAEAALDYALKLRDENEGTLILVHAIPISTLAASAPYEGSPQMIGEVDKAQHEEAEKQMTKLIRKKKLQPGSFRTVIVRRGDPARFIVDQAKKTRAAMIVMGSHGRTGLKRLVLGSVAERTLRYARCPVLIVKK
jgi:nucleotide-binding universal stress UspA family protein